MSVGGKAHAVRFAHQVIRSSDLKKTAEFLNKVFGMEIIRHEVSDKGCDTDGILDFTTSKTHLENAF